MASITTWTRLEPSTRRAEMDAALAACVADPLWFLARQWQFREYAAQDAGTPVMASLHADCARLSRYHPGLPEGSRAIGDAYDPRVLPLETLAEREPVAPTHVPGRPVVRNGGGNARLAAEAGLTFLRLLQDPPAPLSTPYRAQFIDRYKLESPTDDERRDLDSATISFRDLVAGRVPDGVALYADLSAILERNPDLTQLAITWNDPSRDVPIVTRVARSWLAWYQDLLGGTTSASSWVPERLAYEFAVAASIQGGEVVLVAPDHTDGRLDWYSFDLAPDASLGASQDPAAQEIVRTVIPTPASYRGMPAPRWWTFEDARTDFGSVTAGADDLARMLLVEFALVFGNDFFCIPVDLDLGSLCRIRSLIVTDTFGERQLIRSSSEVDAPNADWRLFALTPGQRQGTSPTTPVSPLFFLPPVLGQVLESEPVEDVRLFRDEMANVAWAVERRVEAPGGQRLDRFEAYQEQRARRERDLEAADSSTASQAGIAYRLASTVPDYWFPLLPVQVGTGHRAVALRLGEMAEPPSVGTTEPKGRTLVPYRDGVLIGEEHVPRTGVRVTRAYRSARWTDGSSQFWAGRRRRSGRGEGSSGLRFDAVAPTQE